MNIKIGLVGSGWMGKAHVNAFVNASMLLGKTENNPIFEMVADIDEESVKQACHDLNFNKWTTDWKDIVTNEEIDLVDIATPNAFHYEVAKEALSNGKHVYCEKPLTLSYEQSKELAEIAKEKNVVNYVGYNNLMNPAVHYIKELIEDKALGEIMRFTGTYDQDGLLDPELPITWRHINKLSGSGALGDLGSHLLSISQFLMGDMDEVQSITKTFIKERPKHTGAQELGTVENDDMMSMLAQYQNGAIGSISSSRVAAGRKNHLSFEIQGTKGSIYYTLEAMNEVHVYFTNDNERDRGFRKVFLNPEHKGYGVFQPAAGIAIGYNDMKVLEANTVLNAISEKASYISNFEFASSVDAVVKAILESAELEKWVKVTTSKGAVRS